MTLSRAVFTLSILFALACEADEKSEWGQFRGPNGQGVATSRTPTPVVFDQTQNLLWKIPLEKGLSSPCISKGRIFLTGHDSDNLKTYWYRPSHGENSLGKIRQSGEKGKNASH